MRKDKRQLFRQTENNMHCQTRTNTHLHLFLAQTVTMSNVSRCLTKSGCTFPPFYLPLVCSCCHLNHLLLIRFLHLCYKSVTYWDHLNGTYINYMNNAQDMMKKLEDFQVGCKIFSYIFPICFLYVSDRHKHHFKINWLTKENANLPIYIKSIPSPDFNSMSKCFIMCQCKSERGSEKAALELVFT